MKGKPQAPATVELRNGADYLYCPGCKRIRYMQGGSCLVCGKRGAA